MLETVGYEILCFADLEGALDSLDSSRTSLVFIDTSTVGFELGEDLDRIQSASSEMEFILIAEYQDPLIEQEAVSHGVNNWLYIPFTAPEIILKVASSLEMASQVGPDGVATEAESDSDREGSVSGSETQETS